MITHKETWVGLDASLLAHATGVGMTPHVNRLVQNSAETTARAFFFLINVFPFKGSVNASDEASNFDDYHAGIRGLLIH